MGHPPLKAKGRTPAVFLIVGGRVRESALPCLAGSVFDLRRVKLMPQTTTPKKGVWKPVFIERLRETANVSRAAKSAGVDRRTVYRERERSGAFGEAWDDALEEGTDYLEEEARRRAYEGMRKPVYQGGRRVGEIQEYSDTLMIFLLKGRRREVYGDRVEQENRGTVTHEHRIAGREDHFDRLFAQLDAYRTGFDDGHGEGDRGKPLDSGRADDTPASIPQPSA
jgi:hypothetical protein